MIALLVPPHEVASVWIEVKPLIDIALAHSSEGATANDMLRPIINGACFLWIVVEDHDIVSVCFGEFTQYPDKKGFHIYDTETRELERIVNPYTIYEKIYYDDSKESYKEHDTTKYANKYVKLIVVVKKDLYQFDQFLDKLYAADAVDIKIGEDLS